MSPEKISEEPFWVEFVPCFLFCITLLGFKRVFNNMLPSHKNISYHNNTEAFKAQLHKGEYIYI
jgi:hypothetical protein